MHGFVRFVSEDEIVDHNFSFFGALDKFEEIVAMSTEEKELFSASCFGQFIDHPNITKSHVIRVGDFDGAESDDTLYIEIGRELRAFTGKPSVEITGIYYVDDYSHCDYSTDVDGSLYKEIFLGGVVKNHGVLMSMLSKSKSWENTQK